MSEPETVNSELEELRQLFELRWKADMRAVKRWQKARPGRSLKLPDHADLVVFLLDELEKAEARYTDLHRQHHPQEEIS